MPNGTSVPRKSSHPDATPESRLDLACRRAAAVLAIRPAALITDIDGTISPIVPRPEDARVDTAIRDALEALAALVELVAVITGRDEAVAREMVGARGITYVGNYGLTAGRGVDTAALEQAREEIGSRLAALPCVQLEPKGTGFSLHYRNCDDPEGVRLRLLEVASPLARRANARLMEGKKVIELVPIDLPDKASALRNIVETHGIRGVVYLGDDISDVAVFEEIAALAAAGAVTGLAIAVADSESSRALLDKSDAVLESVDEVGALLASLARRLATRPGVSTSGARE